MKRYILSGLIALWLGFIPSAFSQNYIRKQVFQDEAASQYSDTYTYYDGQGNIGRIVEKDATPTGKDLITEMGYNILGNKTIEWLPTPVTANSNPQGITFLDMVEAYYNDTIPYRRTTYEQSLSGNPIKQAGPGQEWKINDRAIRTAYTLNEASGKLSCALYRITDSSVSKTGNYPQGTLRVTESTDENGNTTLVFSDNLGQMLLQRVIGDNGVYIDTYSVYDDMGQLRLVLPPATADLLATDGSYELSHSAIVRYAYWYKYDDRGLKTVQKLPGAEIEYMIYDKGGRLALRQDGEQRKQNRWSAIKYEPSGRIAIEGYYTTTRSLNDLTALCRNRYENAEFFQRELFAYRDLTPIDGNIYELKSYLYDNINRINQLEDITLVCDQNLSYCAREGYDTRIAGSLEASGLLVGTLERILGDDPRNLIATSYYYDRKRREIQRTSARFDGPFERIYTAYNFSGLPVKQTNEHCLIANDTITEQLRNIYDHRLRLTHNYHKINNAEEKQLFNFRYNELGQLSNKSYPIFPTVPTEQFYSYNIRNWFRHTTFKVMGINYFQERLYYNETTPFEYERNYNGNVSAMSWRCAIEEMGPLRNYKFTYNKTDQLTNALYGESNMFNENQHRYNEKLTYDKMGNILSLQRSGMKSDATFGIIDSLQMYYDGNRLIQVNDSCPNQTNPTLPEFRKGDVSGTQYRYNAVGELIADANKGIDSIAWNEVHLPSFIKFSDGTTIKNYYSASGIKLRSEINRNGQIEKTDYAGNKIYENNKLKMITNDDVLLMPQTDGNYKYYCYIRDHLGNNRMIVGDGRDVKQITHYYPFGLSFAEAMNPDEQPYKFGNKEFITDNGLNWYDFSARTYDPALGRFTSYDPLASEFSFNTPMIYCSNNPIYFIDPTGLEDIPYDKLQMQNYDYNKDNILLNEVTVTTERSSNTISSIGSFLYNNQNEISAASTANGIIEQASNMGADYYKNLITSPLTIQRSKYINCISKLRYLKAIGKISGNIGPLLTVTNIYTNTYAYNEGLISKNQFIYQMLNELGPMATMLVVSTIYGGPIGATAGLTVSAGFTFGEFWHNSIVTTSEKISYFNTNFQNIILGGPYGHIR